MRLIALLVSALSLAWAMPAEQPSSSADSLDTNSDVVMLGDAPTINMMATAAPMWTVRNMSRLCYTGDQSCLWTFYVQEGEAHPTLCAFTVQAANGQPASHSNTGSPQWSDPYFISSGWSGQFGPGNGFTTLAVVDPKRKYIIYPAYTDAQLADAHFVKPDQSYPVLNTP